MKIGITELVVIFMVALLLLGPDKLPVYAKKLGEGLREFRKVSSEVTKDLRESVIEPLEEAQQPLREAMEPITELGKDVREGMEGIRKSFTDLGSASPSGETGASEEAKEAPTGDEPVTEEAPAPEVPQDETRS